MEKHKGWANKLTWSAFTWLNNDYDTSKNLEKMAEKLVDRRQVRDEALNEMKNQVKGMLENNIPPMHTANDVMAGFFMEQINFCLSHIEYHEIAEYFIQGAEESLDKEWEPSMTVTEYVPQNIRVEFEVKYNNRFRQGWALFDIWSIYQRPVLQDWEVTEITLPDEVKDQVNSWLINEVKYVVNQKFTLNRSKDNG